MRYKIGVSGAARIGHCCKGIKEIAKEIGREIARQKCVLVTGATTGVPYIAALGYREVDGISIGFSPAVSRAAHMKTYKLPIDAFDVIVYTGADYAGRDVIMTKSVDGIVIVCGRMGTLHEFATAFETKKPIGVLEGTGGTADKIRYIAKGPYRGMKRIIYDRDPKRLVRRLIESIKKETTKVGE
jgi:uncharacterized protein (TIGR00725 family)